MDIQGYIASKLDKFRKQVADTVVKTASDTANYFNPTSNNGNNFWRTPLAQGLAQTQKVIQQPIQQTVLKAAPQIQQTAQKVTRLVAQQPLYQLPGVIGPQPPSPLTIGQGLSNIKKGVNEYGANQREFLELSKKRRENKLTTEDKVRYDQLLSNQINIIANVGGGTTDINKATAYLRKRLDKESASVLKRFATQVEINGPRAAMSKELGETTQAILTDAFGVQVRNWSNDKMKRTIDLVLGKIGAGKNSAGLGLAVQTLEDAPRRSQNALQAVKQSPEVQRAVRELADDAGIKVTQKVGLLDYLRTPDRVLEKIGLGQQSKQLRTAYESYQKQLPQEIDRITQWAKQVTPEGNVRIFQFLDGKPVQLTPQEQKVANEVRVYLQNWADKLKLPKEKRITNYITHIFEKDFIKKEFDPELAKLIQDKVAGSVYDPFTEQRLGKLGYIEDTWRALDAYVKRATRKVNLDPALQSIKVASENLEQSQFNYVKRYIDRVNMRPTEVDNLIDNTIKQLTGYRFGQRPLAALSRSARQMIYRGTLGLNVGSALRNLTQGANTYARLGEKYTVLGYTKLLTHGFKELEAVGVLADDFVTDRTISATKRFWQSLDKGLFVFFDLAEKINRGSAYYGAKAQALAKGLDEQQAVEYAKKVVRDTQFTFGSIDTPPVLQGDLAKTVLQFQSYNLKQAEFLAEMLKSKDFAGLMRWSAASLGLVFTVGQAIGMKPEQIIPSFRIGGSPLFTGAQQLFDAAANPKDQYGNDRTLVDRAGQVGNTLIPFIPAGVQAKKTVTGLQTVSKGAAETKSGRIKYPVKQDVANYVRGGLFGPSNLPEAREYREQERNPLSEKQSELVRQAQDRFSAYGQVLSARAESKAEDQVRETVRQSGQMQEASGKVFYFKDGEVKTVEIDRQVAKPKLTGNTELDKKLITKYNRELTAKEHDIQALYELGKISAKEAEQRLTAVKKLRVTKGRRLRVPKIKLGTVKVPKPKKIRTKRIKLKKIRVKKIKV